MGQLTKEQFITIGYDKSEVYEQLRPSLSYWQSVRRRFFRNKLVFLIIFILFLVIGMTIIGPKITKFDGKTMDFHMKNKWPSKEHYFGTNNLGQDIFARVWKGARTSITVGMTVASINVIIGIIYGTICGFFGGLIDDIIMRIVEIFMSIPSMVIIMLIALMMKPGIISVIVCMSFVGWCNIARLVRGQVMQITQQEYVLAAQALGASSSRIISQHLITNIISLAVIVITLEVPSVMLWESILGYIGFISYGGNLAWGNVIATGDAIMFYPYQAFIPGVIMSVTLICFNMLGDVLSDALDPRLS